MKTDNSTSNSEVISDIEEDTSMKNNEFAPKKHSSKSIFITEHDTLSNEINLDNFNEEDYLSWVSHSKGKIFINFLLCC